MMSERTHYMRKQKENCSVPNIISCSAYTFMMCCLLYHFILLLETKVVLYAAEMLGKDHNSHVELC